MSYFIGARYKLKQAELRARILEGTISTIETEANKLEKAYTCYFCNQRILGTIEILTDEVSINNTPIQKEYYLHQHCHDEAKRFISNYIAPYLNIRLSLN